jgi:hypothetical protein
MLAQFVVKFGSLDCTSSGVIVISVVGHSWPRVLQEEAAKVEQILSEIRD